MDQLDDRALAKVGRALLSASAVGVVVLDENMAVVEASQGTTRILGRAPAQGTALPSLLAEPADFQRLRESACEIAWQVLAFRMPAAHNLSVRCALGEIGDGKWVLLMERSQDSDAEAIIHAARLSNELTTTVRELELRKRELEAAQSEIRKLDSLLPICSVCRKIRTPDDSWETLEEHVSAHTDSRFSHGMCPVCGPKHFGEFWEG